AGRGGPYHRHNRITLGVFLLEGLHVGLYAPPNVWHTMQYSPGAVQLALASLPFAEDDYIREYDEFRAVWGTGEDR
ncbi:MAG: hypothetical protein EOO60_11345, partial [Hymenobacter sp.]